MPVIRYLRASLARWQLIGIGISSIYAGVGNHFQTWHASAIQNQRLIGAFVVIIALENGGGSNTRGAEWHQACPLSRSNTRPLRSAAIDLINA